MEYQKGRQSIKDWAVGERPREKYLHRGIGALTDAELLAILLGSGTADMSAVDLGRHLLEQHRNLGELARCSYHDLIQTKGIGQAKAICLITAFELGRRKALSEPETRRLDSSSNAIEFFAAHLSDLRTEEFSVAYLNQNNVLIRERRISVGGVGATIVDPKVVFRHGIELMAAAMIVAHNHPSGNPKPSQADIQLTRKLADGAALLDIKLLDHIIIAGNKAYSFADEGML